MHISPLRWVGGKSRAVKQLVQYFPSDNDYRIVCSPFFGGGSMELFLASKGVKVKAYDSFSTLISFWKYLKAEPLNLTAEIKKYFPLSKFEFYQLQNKLIQYEVDKVDSLNVAAIFYVLNRASFSGSTLSGGFSPGTPRLTLSSIEKLKSIDLKNIDFECMDFKDSIEQNSSNFLFCDPPYMLNKSKSNLYGVRGNLHRYFEHEKLAEILNKRKNWLLCYNDCDKIRSLYKGNMIHNPQWTYGMSKQKKSNEIVIVKQ